MAALTAFGTVRLAEKNDVAERYGAEKSGFRTVNLSETEYPDFTYAAESAVDAVLYVEVTKSQQDNGMQRLDPFFNFFFGEPSPRAREQKVSGSGVIIRADGYIVTNNHVIAGASDVKVTLNNNKTYSAQVIGTDKATDIALLKIDETGLPTIPFGDSEKLRLGEWVLAIGSPYNLRSTITAGIVSAKGRSMPSDGEFKIESFIQTDAAVNPGNSGGALLNKAGELVGINTMIYSQTGAYSGYAFAVPSNMVSKIVGDLIDFGTVRRASLGVMMASVNDKIAEELKLSSPKGVYIDEVMKGSAAEKAGLKRDDVIIAMDDTEIATAANLQAKVNSYHPGDKAQVKFIREGREKTVEVVFQGEMSKTGTVTKEGEVAFYGAMLRDASKETLEKLDLESGVEVVSIGPGKMLDAGASEGFVILYVNDQKVSSAKDVLAIARKSDRAVYIEGVTSYGKPSYFAFGK